MTEYIELRGARENNLKDITLRIPKRQITIFTGVSGSGKSSVVFDTDKKIAEYSPEELDLLLWGKDRKYRLQIGGQQMNATYLGVLEKLDRSYVRRDIKAQSERTQKKVEPYLRMRPCPVCKGARLSQAALSSKIDGHDIAELASMEVGDLIAVMRLM